MSPGVTLMIRLADGELVSLSLKRQDALYERLWAQAQRGSVMTALKIKDARNARQRVVRLTEQESVAFREAMQHVLRGQV
jgi:hypothetical protein